MRQILFSLVMFFLHVKTAEAFNLGISVTGEYLPTLQYEAGEEKQQFVYKGHAQSIQLYGTGSVAGVATDFGLYASYASLQNAYQESRFEAAEDGVISETEPGKETLTKTSVGGCLTTHTVKNSWFVSRLSFGLNQLQIIQTGDTPLKQTYKVGAEARISFGAAPPQGRAGPSLEVGYQIVSHANGTEDGTSKKLQTLTGTGFFVSLGISLLVL